MCKCGNDNRSFSARALCPSANAVCCFVLLFLTSLRRLSLILLTLKYMIWIVFLSFRPNRGVFLDHFLLLYVIARSPWKSLFFNTGVNYCRAMHHQAAVVLRRQQKYAYIDRISTNSCVPSKTTQETRWFRVPADRTDRTKRRRKGRGGLAKVYSRNDGGAATAVKIGFISLISRLVRKTCKWIWAEQTNAVLTSNLKLSIESKPKHTSSRSRSGLFATAATGVGGLIRGS